MSDALADYHATLESLDSVIARSRLSLLGFSVAVDAIHLLSAEHIAEIRAQAESGAGSSAELCQKVWPLLREGDDTEVWCDWPDASPWLLGRFPAQFRVGGNAGQAANVLSALGVRSLLAITDRRPVQLATLGSHVRIAQPGGELVAPEEARPTFGPGRPLRHVLEFRAGTPLPNGSVIPRSGRIILRLAYDGPSYDEDFAVVAAKLAHQAGAGLVTGLNKVPPRDVGRAYAWCGERAKEWRAAGVEFVHHELSTYPYQARTIAALTPTVNSLGFSEAELAAFTGLTDPAEGAAAVLVRYGLDRVSVHGDRWALTVSTADPERERQALLLGCLIAAARAEKGEPTRPMALPRDAKPLTEPELPSLGSGQRRSGLSSVCVPTLWLSHPRATVGLGDTFVAGTLLSLGLAAA